MAVYEKPFDKAEYARRVAATKRRMQDAGLDLIICQDPANMCWLTGFNGWSFYVLRDVRAYLPPREANVHRYILLFFMLALILAANWLLILYLAPYIRFNA